MLTFIIPVLHQANVADWSAVKKRLEVTFRSLCAQDNPKWRAIVVANFGADLPPASGAIDVVNVDLQRNILPASGPIELRYKAIRQDKGARLLAGLVHAQPAGHVMVVDYDDMVSRHLAGFVADNADSNGWYFDDGYLYSGDENLLYYKSNFHKFCGTSHVIRADLLKIPKRVEDATDNLTLRWLGSHIFIADDMRSSGTPLARLPFTGSVYRIGYSGTTSGSPNVANYIARTGIGKIVEERGWLRTLNEKLAAEYFGGIAA